MDPEASYSNVLNSLYANKRLQKRLEATLGQVEEMLIGNRDMKGNLKLLGSTENRAGMYGGQRNVELPNVGRVRVSGMGPSRFWLAGGLVPKANEDTLDLLEAFSFLPHNFTVRKWLEEEDAGLAKSIRQHLQEKRQSVAEDAATATCSQLQSPNDTSLNETLSALREPDAMKDVDAFGVEDWQAVAMRLSSVRSGLDCASRWRDWLKPLLASGSEWRSAEQNKKWTAKELKQLDTLAAKYKGRQWMKVASELNTGRTPAECLATFRQRDACSTTRPWTDEEIEQIRVSRATHAGKANFWKAVAADLPNRGPDQVMHFWRNHMDTAVRKGKWTAEEDEALRQAVALVGKKWSRVAEAVPTRNQLQVRERWVNQLDPELRNKQAWSKEEDAILVAALKECRNPDGSHRWAEIAKRLPGRTDDAVSNHVDSMKRSLERVQRKRKRKVAKTDVSSEPSTSNDQAEGKIDVEDDVEKVPAKKRKVQKKDMAPPNAKKPPATKQPKAASDKPTQSKAAAKRQQKSPTAAKAGSRKQKDASAGSKPKAAKPSKAKVSTMAKSPTGCKASKAAGQSKSGTIKKAAASSKKSLAEKVPAKKKQPSAKDAVSKKRKAETVVSTKTREQKKGRNAAEKVASPKAKSANTKRKSV